MLGIFIGTSYLKKVVECVNRMEPEMNIFTKLANGSQYFYGYAVNENTQSIISAGTGFFDMPIRIGTDSEIVEIHVK